MAIGLPFFMLRSPGSGLRKVLSITILTGILLPGFILFYSANFERWGGDVTNVFSEDAAAYLYRGADADADADADAGSRADGAREHSEIGRIDSIVLPFLLLEDPTNWLIGVGIGNASSVSRNTFAGAYSGLNNRYGIDHTTYSHLLWKIGLIGLLMCLVFLYFAYRDARQLSLEEGPQGAIGLAVAGLIPFMLICMAYKNVVFALPVGVGISLLIGNVIALRTQSQSQIQDHSAEKLPRSFSTGRNSGKTLNPITH